jgi:prepilin-type N-terminal cleavage/methylation domain-containing protein
VFYPGPPSSDHSRRGFTLIEVMIVVLLIGVLATFVTPSYRRSMYRAQAAEVVGRVEAIAVGVKNYEADYQILPPGSGPSGSPPAWLAPHLTGNHFAGPAGITFQLTVPEGGGQPILLARAGSGPGDAQILLAAATMLGPAAFTMGGGESIGITLTN